MSFRFSSDPSTRNTSASSSITAAQSSVREMPSLAASPSAWRMSSARNTCGVCMRYSSSRSSVRSTLPPRACRTVSLTCMAGAAAPRSAAAFTARSIISSVTRGLAASWMAMSPACSEHSCTPAQAEAVRSAPPSVTHLSFFMPRSLARAAIVGIFSLCVTTMISSMHPLLSSAASVRSMTVQPPSCIISLSVPIRVPLPAATTTAEQNGLSASACFFPNICTSYRHSYGADCAAPFGFTSRRARCSGAPPLPRSWRSLRGRSPRSGSVLPSAASCAHPWTGPFPYPSA